VMLGQLSELSKPGAGPSLHAAELELEPNHA
jgi:hypothetical protein